MPSSASRIRTSASGFSSSKSNDLALADKVQIQQVLLNLIRNAIESMQDSSKRELVLSTELVEDDMVMISVSDTGAGIAPEIASQLFPALCNDEAARHGSGPFDFAHDHRGPWRQDLG